MGGCLQPSDKGTESPLIDYQRLNIDSLLDLWCAGEVNQIIWKFNKFCQQKGIDKISSKEILQFFPGLRKHYPVQGFHKKIFSLLDHNNDRAINSRELLWGLTLILKLEISRLGEVLFSLYREGNNHYLTDREFKEFLNQNRMLLKNNIQSEAFATLSFQGFNRFVQKNFDLYKFREIFDCTRSPHEVQITEILKKLNGKISLNRGDVVYIMDAKWFMGWKLYMQSKYSLPQIYFIEGDVFVSPKRRSTIGNNQSLFVSLLEEQKCQQKQTSASYYKPSKIDNSHLEGEFQDQLKENLQIYHHFVFVPELLWNMLKQEYGGGPQFRRIYPHLDQLFVTEVFVNSKGKFVEGTSKKKPVSFNSRISQVLGLQQKQMKQFVVYKRSIGQVCWNKISLQGTIAQQSIFYNSFICKIHIDTQQLFLARYNQSTEPKARINYGETIVFNERTESLVGFVVGILEDQVKVHFKGKPSDSDLIVSKEEFLKIVRNSKPQCGPSSSFPGLVNLGNTCYLNSVLQCLMATPIFGDFLTKSSYKQLLRSHKEPKQYPIFQQLSQLSRLSNTSTRFIRPSAFVSLIKKTLTAFDNYDQHDAQQFLVSLLNQLSHELTIKKVKIGKVDSLDLIRETIQQKYCPIQKFFSGVQKRVIKCEHCKNTTVKNQQFFSLGLPVPELQYGYYFATFYPNKQKDKFQPIVQYGMRLKKNAKLREYTQTLCSLIGKPLDILCFCEITRCQISKHFRQSHLDKTLAELYIHSTDICVFQKKSFVNSNKKKYIEDKKRNCPKDLASLEPGTFIDIQSYTQWQVATFISYDRSRKRVKYQLQDSQHEIDEKFVAPFLSKTYYKSLYTIEVQHRKYNPQKGEYEYFFRPFLISIPEWLKWNDVVEAINEEAFRFVDETYWQKVTTAGNSTPSGEEQTLKKNGSDSQLMKQKNQNVGATMHKSELRKQLEETPPQDLLYVESDNNRIPYIIRVLNKSNQLCAICNRRIRNQLIEKDKSQYSTFIRYCKGCPYAGQKPISLIFDLRRITFVLDWYHTLAVNPDSSKAALDISYTKTVQQKETDRFRIQDCLKLYANIQQNIEVTCQKCKHQASSMQCLVSKTPNILVVHLKRFKYSNGYFSKIESQIHCPLQIDLEKITTDKTSSKYELYGILCHLGSGYGGHYYCYIRKGRDKWVLFDDHWTKSVDEISKELNLKHVYLLFFKKVEVDGSLLTLSL